MRRTFLSILMSFMTISALCLSFDDYFSDNTLRIDVKVESEMHNYDVSIDSVSQWPGWYGRRVNLNKEYNPQIMQIIMVDDLSGDTIYIDSKNPNVLAESDRTEAAYVQVFVPKPKSDCRIIANVYGLGDDTTENPLQATVKYSTADLNTIADTENAVVPYKTLRKAADPNHAVNIAILAEGYTADELGKFLRKAEMVDSALFLRQPAFANNAEKFNVVAVMLASEQSGLSIPSKDTAVNSALGAHFDSFGIDRLVTIADTHLMWDALYGIPAAHVLILGNSEMYGGSGSPNEYAIATDGPDYFEETLIHEFGHSFVMLGDEYEYGGYSDLYAPYEEPKAPNITTLYDFSGKWAELILKGDASLIEGAGYQSKGVWRGCEKCLMRAIDDQTFCNVCSQAIERVIDYYTVQQ